MKSLFAVSSLASMAGLVVICVGAGCSDNAPETAVSATEPGDGKTPPPKTSAPPDGGKPDSDGAEAPKTCMDTKPFDATTVPYKPPAVKPGSCTSADIEAFDDYMRNNPKATLEDAKATMTKQSKRCSECVFGTVDDASWAPIVLDGSIATFNGGGCVSVVSKKDECGKSYQQWNACLNEACAACTDKDERLECAKDAQKAGGPCGTASKALLGACGVNVNDYLQACFGNGIGPILEQLCGSPAKDGGS